MATTKKDKKLIQEIREEFFKELESQTSWGKEQLKKMYLEVQSKVLLNAIEEN